MFSQALTDYTRARLARRADLLEPLSEQIEHELASQQQDVAELLRYLYATLPISDVFDAAPGLLASFASHAVMLRREMPWAAEASERIFVHDIACPRINNEPLTDCRDVFWRALRDRVAGKTDVEAVIEVNYWCAERVTYQQSDGRTLDPLALLGCGRGRCGEESTFLVSALRSVGIPARQIYTPCWAHCDDNHAWVEVHVDGRWRYLGACEPEEVLDRGWFTAASGRAMMVRTVLYSDFMCDLTCDRARLARDGSTVIENITSFYAPTTVLNVQVRRADGSPARHVQIDLSYLNAAAWREIGHVITDAKGSASIEIGMGTLRLLASDETSMAETLVSTSETDRVELVLAAAPCAASEPVQRAWCDLDVRAPLDHPAPSSQPAPELLGIGRARRARADEHRRERLDALGARSARSAARVIERYRSAGALAGDDTWEARIGEWFGDAFGNASEIERFLLRDIERDRLELLSTLSKKDCCDATAAILEAHLRHARSLRQASLERIERQGADPELARSLFRSFVLCPRVHTEQLSSASEAIVAAFGDKEREMMIERPASIWERIEREIGFARDEHRFELVASPAAALRSGQAAPQTRRTLFVCIARALGIPARLNPLDLTAQYWDHGSFKEASAVEEPDGSCLELAFPQEGIVYGRDWSLARLIQSAGTGDARMRLKFDMLDLRAEQLPAALREMRLPRGCYRLTSTVRVPAGDQQVSELDFELGDPASVAVRLRVREPEARDMLTRIPLEDFTLESEDGGDLSVAVQAQGHCALVCFLRLREEPTEHLLNELREQAEQLESSELSILLVVPAAAQLSDPTLSRTRSALPEAHLCRQDFSELPERLARRMFAEPGKLPLALLVQTERGGLIGRYAQAGYNVGTVNLVLRLAALANLTVSSQGESGA
ncbi:transglutaminase domain-containing protein [Coriobacterium glomerans PW2]|uniref:Transglutaminase domain-containing protein n=1 Tax=Coriobacterium glomerans (strain ATCC 49209 / DSM 20642 / JCM 10262 / PW2) TaxID=700015 RepID=F2N8D7_CORGP|nr:transglutaminase-like domain-containing protein [Coriobacterium glomerans]AEB07320.1 transglutaminase domain-containing protein [Coriobacterium glomerans PW2]